MARRTETRPGCARWHGRSRRADAARRRAAWADGPVLLEVENPCHSWTAFAILARELAPRLHAVADILTNSHMRIERIVLEHHRAITQAWAQLRHIAITDTDGSAGDRLQSRYHAQRRGLAAAGRSDKHDKLLVGHTQIKPLDDLVGPICLADVLDLDVRHGSLFPSLYRRPTKPG